MECDEEKRQIIIERGPPSGPYAKIIIPEKRQGPKDRRKIYTFIADDRRSGIADRRNPKRV